MGLMSKEVKSVAVIMLNYNQWKMTRDCAISVLESDYSSFKLFVFDNGSHDIEEYNNLKELSADNCEVHRIEKNCGYVGGMNYGLEFVTERGYDLVLVMNNDATIDNKAMSEFVSTSEKYNYKAIVTGKVYHFDRPNEIQHIGYRFSNRKLLKMERIVSDKVDDGSWDKEMEMDMIDDIFWLMPVKLYREIGGYSTYFWFNAEQADLALRAVKNGYKLIYTPKAKLYHKGSISIGGRDNNPKLVYYNTQASLILRYLHLPLFRFVGIYLSTIYRLFRSLVKMIVKKGANRKLLKADFLAFMYFNKWLFTRSPNNGITPFDK
jgi:GT2 family glycosyltransferase